MDADCALASANKAAGIVLNPKQRARLRKIVSNERPLTVLSLSGWDIDLLAMGLIQKKEQEFSCYASLYATPLGIQVIALERQRSTAALKTHNTLATRLASHLRTQRKLTWENIEIDNRIEKPGERTWTLVRPDVIACNITNLAVNAHCEIYEVKVTRSDFMAEMAKPAKLGAARMLAEAVYFCTPAGLLKPEEIPEGVGLIEEQEEGRFAIAKRAKRTKNYVPHCDLIMTLMCKAKVAEDNKDPTD